MPVAPLDDVLQEMVARAPDRRALVNIARIVETYPALRRRIPPELLEKIER